MSTRTEIEQELRKQFEEMLPMLVESILLDTSNPSAVGLFTTWCSPDPDLSDEEWFDAYPDQTVRCLPKVEIVRVERDHQDADDEGATLQ